LLNLEKRFNRFLTFINRDDLQKPGSLIDISDKTVNDAGP